MKRILFYYSIISASLFCFACNERGGSDPIDDIDCSKVYAEVPAFIPELGSSRMDISINSSGASFNWNAADTLGVFPQQGYQVAFSPSADQLASSSSQSVFDGGTWRLRNHATYAAYYPFSEEAYDLTAETLKASYTPQCQVGNNKTTHLSAHDYLASPFVSVSGSQQTLFELSHLGSLVRFVITAPKSDTWKYLQLKGAEGEFISEATYSLRESEPVLHPVSTTDTLRINMSGITTDDTHRTIVLYAMVASNPLATPSEWIFYLCGDGGTYKDTLSNTPEKPTLVRTFKTGICYSRSVPFDGVNLGEDWSIPINDDTGQYDPSQPILAPGYIGFQASGFVFEHETGSRMTMQEGEAVSFVWHEDDVLGVYPETGNQTAFPISSQAGNELALFDGNDWALRNDCKYAAYFPFSQANFHNRPEALPVSFENQVLDGDHPMDNVGKYNYSYAPLTQTDENESVKFTFKSLSTLVKVNMICPEADSFTKLSIGDPQLGIAHRATYNLKSDSPCLVAPQNEFYESLDFTMNNYSTSNAGAQLTAYFVLMPEDHRTGNFQFTLYGNNGVYTASANGKQLVAGRALVFNLEMQRIE